MMITKYEFRGEKDGISLLILAAVHGNETAGTQACFRIIDEFNRGALRLTGGHLTLVPVCNPEAYRKDVRSIDENLNRVIKMHDNPQSYEQRLANEICPLIRSHRFTLDLHSTHCVGDVPFAFCDYPDDYNRKVIEALPVDYVLEGWPEIYGRQAQIQDFLPSNVRMFTETRQRLWNAVTIRNRKRRNLLIGQSSALWLLLIWLICPSRRLMRKHIFR